MAINFAIETLRCRVLDRECCIGVEVVHRLVHNEEQRALIDACSFEVGDVEESYRYGFIYLIIQLFDTVVDESRQEWLRIVQCEHINHFAQVCTYINGKFRAIIFAYNFDYWCHKVIV